MNDSLCRKRLLGQVDTIHATKQDQSLIISSLTDSVQVIPASRTKPTTDPECEPERILNRTPGKHTSNEYRTNRDRFLTSTITQHQFCRK